MIFGIFHHDRNQPVGREHLFQLQPKKLAPKPTNTSLDGNVAFGVSELGITTIDDGIGIAQNTDKSNTVAATGSIFHCDCADVKKTADAVLAVYEKYGEAGFKSLNGQFAAAIWDKKKNKFLLVLDHLGFEPLYYYFDDDVLIFSSSLQSFRQSSYVENNHNFRTVRNYLLFNYNPGLESFIKGVKKVRPGSCLVVQNNKITTQRYWFLSYQNQNGRQVEEYTEEMLDLTKDAIRIRTNEDNSDPGAFLSGGMDSSSVVGLMHGLVEKPVHTFSFRCPEKDVDESYFARVMAEHYKTEHKEIPFTAEALVNLENMASAMDEPLCDIGVELGSYIMGRAAQNQVGYILTGDGGDELYAGHPVYVADQMAEKFDRLPGFLRNTVTKTAQLLPDSQRKKSLLIKARRFSYSYQFPQELLSNRWRIYYDDNELMSLSNPDIASEFGELHSYEDITGLYEDADGPDNLSRSLYGDYQTLVRFHIDRLRLTRASGVEARFPLHDYRLIEFSATIPASLKIRDGQVKYIQKKALTGVLPDEIVFRKDKMGHNVPMKGWMRNSKIFLDLIHDVLSDSSVKARGYFQADVIQTMLDLHLRKKKDYSHRLYALLILELWLRNNFDN